MCGNEVLQAAARRNCFERWEHPIFFKKQSLVVNCLIFIKISTLGFAIYLFIVIRNAFEN